jgi:integrase
MVECRSRLAPNRKPRHRHLQTKRPRKLPVVLTQDEVARLIETLEQPFWLMATLLYGSGLRLMDCRRLRVKDLDFGYQQIVVLGSLATTRDELPAGAVSQKPAKRASSGQVKRMVCPAFSTINNLRSSDCGWLAQLNAFRTAGDVFIEIRL